MNTNILKPLFLMLLIVISCNVNAQQKTRQAVDSIGFATKAWQMDSVVQRINRTYGAFIDSVNKVNGLEPDIAFRLAICPHDDYTYAGFLYKCALSHIKAKTVIIFGVAHKAKNFGIEQKLVFDSFNSWKEPYGKVKVSPLRDEIIKRLPQGDYIIHDSLQQAEHSVEAIVPFLQYQTRDVQLIPILVPYMDFTMMEKYAGDLARVLKQLIKAHGLQWGRDIAIVISNDAVHYGDEEWGGRNYATYGCDAAGYQKAVHHENEIIANALLPRPDTTSVRKFFNYTVEPGNWREYRWPWCGRYSVPVGLLTGMYLGEMRGDNIHSGILMGYSTSIAHQPLPVEDLMMGKTAIATLHHWVGYAAIGYR